MPNFNHGVTVTEVESGARTITTASSSVIGVVGTAPDAAADDFPLNTPVLIAGSYAAAAKLGTTGTLPSALDGILAQAGAMVVVVRVAESDEEDPEDAEAENILNVIGAVNVDGTYTGLYALLSAKSVLGLSPKILITPGFNDAGVITALKTIVGRLRAIAVVDTPTDTDANVVQFATTCASDRVYAIYPKVLNGSSIAVPASSYVAGVIAKNDNENGFYFSPSNNTISGITGLSKSVDFSLGDSACKADYFNENNIATIINHDGYRLWGNRTTATTGSYKFLCVRRTADMISESILQAHLWAVDRNIVKNYLSDVAESVNAFLGNLKSKGAILAGSCSANRELNTAANIAEGKVYFDFDFTPAYPAEHVNFRAYLNNDDIETLLLENLAA